MSGNIRIQIRKFIKKYAKWILIVLFIWLMMLVANVLLRNQKEETTPQTTYQPHESVMDSKTKVPTKLQEPINNTIDSYFNYCNNKQYEEAYQMLSQGCKDEYFPTIEYFKKYIDTIFNENKIYYIQNYSNRGNIYIYRLRILEDVLKTGLTGKENVSYYEEKMVIEEQKDGSLALSVRQHITTKDLEEIYEDDYLKIWIEKVTINYETETYTVKIKNKTPNIAVLADGTEELETYLKVGSQSRECLEDNLKIVIMPEQTEEYKLQFNKFYDEDDTTYGIVFNAVRILKQYSGIEITKDTEMKNAVKLYSIEIPF